MVNTLTFLADNFSNDSEFFHSVFFSAKYSDYVTFRTDPGKLRAYFCIYSSQYEKTQ